MTTKKNLENSLNALRDGVERRKTKPEYDIWAEIMLQEIYHTPEEHRVDYIKEQLLKAVKRGYLDGVESGWWEELEKCKHELDMDLDFPYCVKCGADI